MSDGSSSPGFDRPADLNFVDRVLKEHADAYARQIGLANTSPQPLRRNLVSSPPTAARQAYPSIDSQSFARRTSPSPSRTAIGGHEMVPVSFERLSRNVLECATGENDDDSGPDFSDDVSAVLPGGGFYGVFTSTTSFGLGQHTVQPNRSRWVQYDPVKARAPSPQSHPGEPSSNVAPLHSVADAPLSGGSLDAANPGPEQASTSLPSAWAAGDETHGQGTPSAVPSTQRREPQGPVLLPTVVASGSVPSDGEFTAGVASASTSLNAKKRSTISRKAQTPGSQPQLTERQKRYRQERAAAEAMAAWNTASTTFELNSDGNWDFVGQGHLSLNAEESRARDARISRINESMPTLVRPEASSGSYPPVPVPSYDGEGHSVHPALTQGGTAGGSDVDHWGLRDPVTADADIAGNLAEPVPEWNEWIVDADGGDGEIHFP